MHLNNEFFGSVKMRLNTKYRIDQQLIVKKYYDLKTLLYLQRLIKKGDTCIDIGANVGSITFPLINLAGQKGFVFSFEPGPLLFSQLEESIRLNDLSNVMAFPFGLSNKPGNLFWKFDPTNPGNAFIIKEDDKSGVKSVEVKRLDDIKEVAESKKIDFIKVDVEGMEYEVFQGAENILKKHKPTLLYETYVETNSDKISKMQNFLTSLGYQFYEIEFPEKELFPGKLDFNFVPCSFPTLPQNTLAVHQSKLSILKR